ncbi:MAG: hypothetical protein IJ752_03370 [Alphaproteobacteria bacterium]|nr:hypothetical protein [Alphaproteobacteria bacterium]
MIKIALVNEDAENLNDVKVLSAVIKEQMKDEDTCYKTSRAASASVRKGLRRMRCVFDDKGRLISLKKRNNKRLSIETEAKERLNARQKKLRKNRSCLTF